MLPDAKLTQPPQKLDWLPGAALGIVFAGLYFWLGTAMGATGALTEYSDLMFTSDLPRVVEDLAVFHARHWRSYPHPLFVLFLNPVGTILSKVIGSPVNSAVALNATAGGICALLTWLLVRRIGLPRLTAALLTCTLGASAAHLFFGSMPETYIFSAAALLLLALCVLAAPGNLKWAVPAGVLALGFLVTNFVQAILIFFFGSESVPGRWGHMRKAALYAVLVVATAAALNLVQKVIYPQTGIFFRPRAVTHEKKYVEIPKTPHAIASRGLSLAGHLFIFDFVAPRPTITRGAGRPPSVTFNQKNLRTWNYTGLVAAAMLAGIWCSVSIMLFRWSLVKNPLVRAAIACIGFNFILHSIYGDQLFLYVCNWTWAFLLILAYTCLECLKRGWQTAINSTLAVLLLLLSFNNIAFVRDLIALYGQFRPTP